MRQEISDRFSTLALRPDSLEGLAEGALILAAEAKPEVDVERGVAAVTELADRTRPFVENASTVGGRIEALNHALFELERFRGNQEQYDDPRNSFLDDVLERRRGLPITLSVLYVDVARRVGLEAYGVGFPGHFLAKIVGVPESPDGEVIIDPFFGRILHREDCAERLRAAAGDEIPLDSRWLAPATAQEIYVRILNNLKLNYLQRGDALGALGCFDRILLLAPLAASEYRDRGLLLERLDCILPAIEDLGRFLELAPRDESAPSMRARRDALAQRKPTLN